MSIEFRVCNHRVSGSNSSKENRFLHFIEKTSALLVGNYSESKCHGVSMKFLKGSD